HLIERAAARLRSTGAAGAASNAGSYSTPTHSSVYEQPKAAKITSDPAQTRSQITTAALTEAGLLSWEQPNNRVAEEFRIIQEKILRQSFGTNGSAAHDHKNLVMITSALTGEGKTFCALNIAGEIARQGDRRVLLVDADPKPHGLTRIAGVGADPGLRDLGNSRQLELANV